MLDNKLADKSTAEKHYFLRRSGLYWIILGFLLLLPELFNFSSFGSEFLFIVLAFVLIVIGLPSTQSPFYKTLSLIEIGVCLILGGGLFWLGKTFGSNSRMTLPTTFLAIGIFLQIWAESLWRTGLTHNSVNNLIERIRHL